MSTRWPAQLTVALADYICMPAVLVTGLLLEAKLTISSLAVTKVLIRTHCTNPRRDSQTELAWVASYIPRWFAENSSAMSLVKQQNLPILFLFISNKSTHSRTVWCVSTNE